MKPMHIYAEEPSDFLSGSGKLWLEGFKSASPSGQYNLIEEQRKDSPLNEEYRKRPSNVKPVPIEQEMRNKEYRELIKQRNKLLREKTA